MKLFLIQLLPLIVFIVVDSFVADVRISILAAILFAAGQMVFVYVHSRRFEWLILIDVGLIAGLGGVSIAFDDELFFKVKPAIIEGVVIVFIAVLILAPGRFLMRYFGRMMPGTVFRPEAMKMMKLMLGLICAGTAVHIGGVLYTAFYSSKEVWAFVSGPGFYIIVLPIGVIPVIIKRLRASA
jgi:intracellular septation protein A